LGNENGMRIIKRGAERELLMAANADSTPKVDNQEIIEITQEH
jgi:hypothetical protein